MDEAAFLETNIAEFRRMFLAAELARRGLPEEHPVSIAVVELRPGAAPKVTIDEETRVRLRAVAGSSVQAGDLLTVENVNEIEYAVPVGVHPDAGWWLFIDLPFLRMTAFDFGRNRGQALRELDRADEFLELAGIGFEEGLLGPAAENLFAAAELAAVAQLRLHDDEVPRQHAERRRSWRKWTELGNAPVEHSKALARLAALRSHARYAGAGRKPKGHLLCADLDVVAEMIAFARQQVAPRYRAA